MNGEKQNNEAKASAEPKWFLRSKTILGAVVGLLPHVLAGLGLSFDDGEVQNLATKGSAFLMAILVVWGRATAKQPVSALPQKASEFTASAVVAGAIGSLALQGCSTTVYGADGRPQLRTFGDATGLVFTGPGTSLRAERLDHSVPTKTAFNGATSVLTAAGTAVATGGVR